MSDGREPAVLGADGGSTKTDVVLVDANGMLLGRARGPASGHQLLGLEAAMDALGATIDAALADAGLPTGTVVPTGVYCLSGIDLPVDERLVGPTVEDRGWTTTSDVRNDTFAVLRAGVSSGWGVAVVCGTGLNCVGLGPDGSTVRFPALGELSGDYAQGGSWLGLRGLGVALRAADGRGGPTTLSTLVPEHFGVTSAEDVLEAVYTGQLSYSRLFELAEVVLAAARDGDGPAAGAVGVLVDEAVAMVVAAVERIDIGSAPVEVVVGGSLFDDEGFSHRVFEGVRAKAPGAAPRRLLGPPVLGAALLGLDEVAAGAEAEAALRAALETD
ncbi:MAG TPA: BadF/BadG/BcrA/BcrD ATPase family protein [Acidimicrobiales bacterium]|nr:BadF/BadG/BcrA/BcrD ATPase family protein [Acidimicrobiales bacterium]